MEDRSLHMDFRKIPRGAVNAALGLAVPVFLYFFLFVSVSRTVSIAGKILPAREWLLAKNNQGGVLATFSDYLRGNVDTYTVVSIVRGDAFRFSLKSTLKPGDTVSPGDTVVRIESHELTRELDRLSGELSVARATLASTKSGEKQAIVQQAQRELVLAREDSALQTALFIRQDSLYHKDLVSREQYDLARSAAQVAAITCAIAEARLQTVTTGAKPEEIRMIESQISGLERQIETLSSQLGALTLVSPLAGTYLSSPGTDTLCTIEDTSHVALIPVPVEYLSRVVPGQPVTLRVPPHWQACGGRLARVDRQVRIVNGRQVVMAIAVLNAGTPALPSHLVMVGTIETDRVSPAHFLLYWISDLFAEIVGGTTGT